MPQLGWAMGYGAGAPGLSHALAMRQVTPLSTLQGTLSTLQMSRDILYETGGRTVRDRLAQLQY